MSRLLSRFRTMRLFSIIAILFFLSSCQSTGPPVTPYDHCARPGWELMPEWPDNRSVLLAQTLRIDPLDSLETSISDYLDSYVNLDQETWFSRTNGELLICRYDADDDPCDGLAKAMIFTPREDGWGTTELIAEICVAVHNVPEILLAEPAYVTLDEEDLARWKKIAVEAATSSEAWIRFGGLQLIEGPFNVDSTHVEFNYPINNCLRYAPEGYDEYCDLIKVVISTDQYVGWHNVFFEISIERESGKVVEMKEQYIRIIEVR